MAEISGAAKTVLWRTGILFLWIVLAVMGSVLYGLINDQITVTISPEYYSVFKRRQFAPVLGPMGLADASPRMLAMFVGALATWWYGLFLGIMLGISSMVGRFAPLPTRRYIGAIGSVMAATFGISLLFAAVAYMVEPLVKPDALHWPFLTGIKEVRRAFTIGWWHNGSYLGALVAAIKASLRVQRQRRLA